MISSTNEHRGFYSLTFASQLIVWATRKRLHLLAGGADDSEVLRAFELGGLQDAHTALMWIIDVLTCGASNRIELHAVACPCLAGHEIYLLNALASLQRGEHEHSQRWTAGLFRGPAARFVLPAMRAIVATLDGRNLRLDGRAASPERGGRTALVGDTVH